jgi:hypothetical protein
LTDDRQWPVDALGDAVHEALLEHTYLDLDHTMATGVLEYVVKPVGAEFGALLRFESVVKRRSSASRDCSIQYNSNAIGMRIVPVNQFLYVVQKLVRGSLTYYVESLEKQRIFMTLQL